MKTSRLAFATIIVGAAFLAAAPSPFADPPAPTREAQAATTPDAALARLREGNERFVSRKSFARDHPAQVRSTAAAQFPIAAVLGCMDSRVPPEIVFDQGLGDLIGVRIAGNFADTDIVGSLEYAAAVLDVRLILVLGHSDCGAIRGAIDGVRLGSLTETLAHLAPAVAATECAEGARSGANAPFVQRVAETNVRLTAKALADRSPILADLARKGRIRIVGGMYDLSTGRVTILE